MSTLRGWPYRYNGRYVRCGNVPYLTLRRFFTRIVSIRLAGLQPYVIGHSAATSPTSGFLASQAQWITFQHFLGIS